MRPDPPFNCTSGDRTLFSVHVWCTQGFDGGVAQRFALEAYDSAGRADGEPSGPDDGYGGPAVAADGPAPPMLANLTSDRPDFTLRQLSPSVGLRLAVYAYNSRGTSDRTWLTAYTLNSADKQTTSGTYNDTYIIYYHYCQPFTAYWRRVISHFRGQRLIDVYDIDVCLYIMHRDVNKLLSFLKMYYIYDLFDLIIDLIIIII